ncbi:MAG: anaerobic ribonucleoside-triphosphate reductase activating protein [Clostridia bacterium]|nr:anaerobic ribonucleoside-triphosphate reductase activating protein [Clostridia bacterium]MBQ2326192.1 anaerobic ribonucleoside-triphosphate reductase activating protein [Clostridia bacterium]
MSDIRINGIVSESITDGPGIRYTVFTQGCAHNCPGCHNPETHDYNGGSFKSTEEMLEAIRRDPMITGVTLSGGEPFDQADKLLEFAKAVKEMKLELAAYTGYVYEKLLSEGGSRGELLRLLDVVIDGPFIMDQRNLDIRFKGSENQRIIDVPASLSRGEVVLKEDGRWIAGEDPFPAIVPERV